MIMFRVYFANGKSVQVSAESPTEARQKALTASQGFRVMKVKRLKEQPTCPPFNSSFSSPATGSRSGS